MLTTQFFAMKIQRYMHEHGITTSTLAKVAAKAFRNGSINPNAWRRAPLSEEDIASSAMISILSPSTCSVRPVKAPSPSCCAGPITPAATPINRSTSRRRRCVRGALDRSKCSARGWPSHGPTAQRSGVPSGIRPSRDRAPRIHVAQVQDTESGAEVMHMAENGLCKHGEQEALVRSGATEMGGRCRSTPMGDVSPTASRSAHRGCVGVRECPATTGGCRRPPG